MVTKINPGKRFENNWKNSVPEDVLYYRLKDSAQAFDTQNKRTSKLRFSLTNPCDCFMFKSPFLYALELKHTSSTSMSFERDKSEKNKMIHYHQIKGLAEFDRYENTICGFLLNFHHKKDDTETLYFQYIKDFNIMISEILKKSLNEKDLMNYNAMIVPSRKMRTNYKYDVNSFMEKTQEEYYGK